MTQLDLGNILSLYFVDVKALHKVWHNVGFLLRLTYYAYSFVNIKQYFGQPHKQVQLVLLFVEVKSKLAFDTPYSEFDPFIEYVDYAKLTRN